jgi:hypothetical protein
LPYTIDEEAAKKQMSLNITRGQEVVPRQPNGSLRDGWMGTVNGGLPVKEIPFLDFPRVIYLHPNRPFREIEHRDTNHQLVDKELVATDHMTKVINTEAELKAALADGWQTKPYIPAAPEKKDGDLYGARSNKKGESK